MRKKRKPRGHKQNGEKSYDMCPYCYLPDCDPFGGSPLYRNKIQKRLSEGRCPACGHVKCTCKSSILDEEKFKERENMRIKNYKKGE